MKNGTVALKDGQMDYICFGRGTRHLVMLPGLGDALRSVRGTALPMALMYRIFAGDFTVWMFSRKQPLKALCTTRDLARDQAEAMEKLGIGKADIFGVSMGGMIAQHLAIDYPEKVGKLVLAVTCAQPNPVLAESVGEWVSYARQDDPAGFMDSNLRRIYSEDYYRKNKWMAPVVGWLTKPKSYQRFFIQADACLTHDAHENLGKIQAPALVIGGEQDKALGGEASREIAAAIPGAKLHMYPQWGHGAYEEAKDFNSLVLKFLMEE
jgi:pimeloyl-ACP methyl ester carboxylesterase